MVHALNEALRVLKPNGLLLDLRPAAVHRRVGFTDADGYRLRWIMRENFEDDRAADRAVTEIVRIGMVRAEGRTRFECYRVMDTLDDFQEWLTDFIKKGNFPSHDWLVRRVERELGATAKKTKIVVSAPLVLRVLRKTGK